MIPLTLNHSLIFSPIAGKPKAPSRLARASMSSSVIDFPHLSSVHRALMVDLISTVESSLGPKLLSSIVPLDVKFFKSPINASEGALDIKSGAPDSSVEFILESWLHCKLPTEVVIDITSLVAFLNSATNAPHLLIEFIQSSPTSMTLIMDLLPRTDLIMYPEYLAEFYQATSLDQFRKEIENVPQVLPYRSSELYFRSMFSPTAIIVSVDCSKEGEAAMEEILVGKLSSAAKEIVAIWLGTCACSTKQLSEEEKLKLVKRDYLMKSKAIEVDLSANLPALFGPDIGGRVVREIQKAYRV